jgi:cytochrome b involved in lipid metabolism
MIFSVAALLLISGGSRDASAFSTVGLTAFSTSRSHSSSAAANSRLSAALVQDTTTTSSTTTNDKAADIDFSSASSTSTTWNCDADANCVPAEACDDTSCRTSLDVRIHNIWYDLSGWRQAHPAGTHWIDWYDGRDATEVMDGFHSDKAIKMYQRLPKSQPQTTEWLERTVAEDTTTQLNFRKLRLELGVEGFWERDMLHEATQIGLWASFVVAAVMTRDVPLLSTSCLAISMSAAGWLGHDYIHGVDEFANKWRLFAAYSGESEERSWSFYLPS